LKNNQKELRKELKELHQTWIQSQKTLKWWKNETGYTKTNIRKLCNIPLSHPKSIIQIGCLYLLHLDFMYQRTCEPAIFKYRADVFDFLKKNVSKHNLQVQNNGLFPW
jgi:hypothetical protein